jgi:enoyl-CoA hydratase
MSDQPVLMEKDGAAAVITISRPEALNALNSATLKALKDVVAQVRNDRDIRYVIVTGSGEKAFVAGADIKEMLDLNPIQTREFMLLGQSAFNDLEDLPQPVIAAVNGFALGGGSELAMACDIIVASEKAKFGLPEVTLGIHPGFGGTQRLPRLVGKAVAKELIFTGKMIGAQEAKDIGLVNSVVPPDQLMDAVRELGQKIAGNGPVAVQLAKSAVNRGTETDLGTGLAYEADTISLAFSTKDAREGMSAFIEKRKPDFKGE